MWRRHGAARCSVDFVKSFVRLTRTQWKTKTMPGQSILNEYVIAFKELNKGERKFRNRGFNRQASIDGGAANWSVHGQW